MSDSDSDYSTPSLPPTLTPLSLVPSAMTSHISNPRSFLSPSEVTYQHCINALRDTLNIGLSLHGNKDTKSLHQLYTEGFDQEQIWQQLELWNVPIFKNLSADVQRLVTADIQILQENGENISVSGSSNHSQIVNEDLEQMNSSSEDPQTDSDSNEPGIDDNPEDSNLMEEFLQQEEKNYNQEEGSLQSSDGESEEIPEPAVSEAAGVKYKDFFQDKITDKPSNKSNYTREKEKLQSRIEELEKDNMAEKRWEMSGEVSSKFRPDNSLLEGYMKHQSNPGVPRITEEATEELEDLIRRRARDELWDDPVRREKPQEKRYNYSIPKQVDTQKSQLGLAEVYEQEFLKQTAATSNILRTEEQTMEDEIKVMMKEVFGKLDALSNFRYTPKPFKYEPIVIKNVPVVSVEEVIPTAMSTSDRLAPEEIAASSRAVVSEIERTQEDRKKLRRHKTRVVSRKMYLRAQKIVNKTKPGMGNSYSKRKLLQVLAEAKHMQGDREQLIHDERARKRDKSFKSSRTFFSKLEKEAKNDIERKSDKRVKNRLSATAIKV